MNCANHPAEAAVAQCTECGKGLCVQCVQNQPKPVCAACHEKLRSQTVGSIVFHLLVYVGLFILGYKLNFMEGNGFPDGRFASGYTLMAVVSGWQFLNSVVGWRLVQGDLTAWAIYYVLKLLLSVIVGFFTNHRRLNIESPYILRRPVQQNSRRKRHVKAMPCLCRLRRLFGSCCPGVPGSLKFYSL